MDIKEKKAAGSAALLWKEMKRNKVAYAYIAPFYIIFAIFGLFPIVSGFVISFFNWNGSNAMKFIGLKNYTDLLTDPMFWRSVYNTLFIGLIAHIPILFGGLVLAYVLNSDLIRHRNIFKTIYFLPVVASAVAITLVFQLMFGFNFGSINFFLQEAGFSKINWLGGTGAFIKPAVIIMFAWKWVGWNMVIYLAGLQGISKDIYEAAIVDGANHGNIFFRITIPLLKPIIAFTMINSSIGTMNLFTEPFVLTNNIRGGVGSQGMTVMMYLMDKAPFGNNLYSYASACAYVVTAIIMLLSVISMNTVGKTDDAKEGRKRK